MRFKLESRHQSHDFKCQRKKVRRGVRRRRRRRIQKIKFIVFFFRAVDHMSLEHIETRGVCFSHTLALPYLHYKGMYLKGKKMNYGNSYTSPCKNTIFQKKSSKRIHNCFKIS
jgi:hypothetical protein